MRTATDCGEMDGGDMREEIVGNACGGEPGSHGSEATVRVTCSGWSRLHSLSVSTGQQRQLSNSEAGPSTA